MRKMVLTMVLAAAPACAFAQANTSPGSTSAARPGVSNNLNNPQEQANQAGQPGNARSLPSSGDAKAMPMPTVQGGGMAPIPQQPKPSSSNAIR